MLIRITTTFLLLVLGALSFWTSDLQAQFTPVSEGANWQRTVRVMNQIEPYDPYNQMSLFDRLSDEQEEMKVSRDYVHFANVTSTFWEVLRDSINEAVKDGELSVYRVTPSEQRNQEFIYIKGEQIPNEELVPFLEQSFNTYVNEEFGTAAAQQTAPFYFNSTDNNLFRLPQRPPVYENLVDIDLFQIELIIYNDETGFGIKPTKLLFTTALYNSQVDYEQGNVVDRFPPELGFMIDLTEDEAVRMLTETGIQFSGEYNLMSFYDLITLFHYDYFYYSVSNQDLRTAELNFPDVYDLDELRQSTQNYFNDLIFSFTYGQPPNWWSENDRGGITNGLFEISDEYQQRMEENGAAEAENGEEGEN